MISVLLTAKPNECFFVRNLGRPFNADAPSYADITVKRKTVKSFCSNCLPKNFNSPYENQKPMGDTLYKVPGLPGRVLSAVDKGGYCRDCGHAVFYSDKYSYGFSSRDIRMQEHAENSLELLNDKTP